MLLKQPDLFKDWSITFRDYSARYKTRKEKALSSLNLAIRHGERIGVVGRTGSGKSTLILSLMRSIPWTEGRIEIGGKDIAKVTLSDLRSNISVILQEHFLFTGTVREVILSLSRTSTPLPPSPTRGLEKCCSFADYGRAWKRGEDWTRR